MTCRPHVVISSLVRSLDGDLALWPDMRLGVGLDQEGFRRQSATSGTLPAAIITSWPGSLAIISQLLHGEWYLTKKPSAQTMSSPYWPAAMTPVW